MSLTRRFFLKTGATVTTVALTNALSARPLLASFGDRPEPVPPIQDPRIKALVQRGLDAAMQAGAQYADIRLTHDRERKFHYFGYRDYNDIRDSESMAIGIRALVNGYWGFSASSVWTPEEVVRLAHEAVAQAKTNTLGNPRVVELAPRLRIEDSHWTMPVKIDPFTVHPVEIMECLGGLNNYVMRQPNCSVYERENGCTIYQQEKAFGASDGSYFTQRTYRTGGFLRIAFNPPSRYKFNSSVEGIGLSSVGWELYEDQPIRAYIDRTIEELREDAKLPEKPIDVGRYDAVLSAQAIGSILNGSIGAATELDRALGYEANAGGTSYLNQPLEMLGIYKLGAPLLSVTATRNHPGGLAWVQWDDEGVRPEPFLLVKDGVVVNFQTTRESAAWLKPQNATANSSLKSLGCAAAPTADDAPLTHTPDLVLHPGVENKDFDGLIADMSKGIAFKSLNTEMDFQQLNGFGVGKAYKIQKGKKVAIYQKLGILFRSSEFWKTILVLGGPASVQRIPSGGSKGQPKQYIHHSVIAVPGLVKDLSIIDPYRRA
jgi:TldD protein